VQPSKIPPLHGCSGGIFLRKKMAGMQRKEVIGWTTETQKNNPFKTFDIFLQRSNYWYIAT
jgi:hypothetical protein